MSSKRRKRSWSQRVSSKIDSIFFKKKEKEEQPKVVFSKESDAEPEPIPAEGINLFDQSAVSSLNHHKKKKQHKGAAYVGRVVLSIFLIGVITTCLVAGAFMVYVFAFIDGTMDVDLNNLDLNYTSIIFVKNKETGEYEEAKRLHGEENRIWVSLSQIPKDLQNAVVSVEDKRFFEHDGVDWKRTFSAFANLFFHFYDTKQGASTITQQLVKNLTGDDDVTIPRKIKEIMRARYLEGKFTKETILECYLNTIHLGPGRDGVQVAANSMFDKDVSELSLIQCACIAAVIKAPDGEFNPYSHPENNKERREFILKEMLNNGYISEDEYNYALTDDLGLVDPNAKKDDDEDGETDSSVNTYFEDAIIEDVIQGLMEEEGYTYDYAEDMIYKGGYQIYSTMDADIQKIIDDFVADESNFMKVGSGETQPQAAMVIMDYEGHIVGMMGGRGEKTQNRSFNFATMAKRQPGSSMKPIGAYAPALEYNLITWGSTIVDKPYFKVDGSDWPRNYSRSYSYGRVSMEYAVSRSLNTIPAYLVNKLGIDRSFEFATQRLGLSTLVESQTTKDGKVLSDKNLSALALGGTTYGVTVRDMAGAYATFGNLGKYYKPLTYSKVEKNNEIVLQQTETPEIAMAEETANIMNELLQSVVGSGGTGRGIDMGDMPVYAKTGTTTDEKDRWFIGGTPYYIAACWFGFENPKPMYVSGNPAMRVWRPIMQEIHEDLELKDFPRSDNCLYMRYCTDSGMPATANCSNTKIGWFKTSNLACTTHGGKKLDPLDKPKPVGYTEPTTNRDDDDGKKPTAAATKTTSAPKTTAPAAAGTTETTRTSAATTQRTEPVTTAPITTTEPPTEPTTQPVIQPSSATEPST